MKQKKGISDIIKITLVLAIVAWINHMPVLEFIATGVGYGIVFVIASRITKGETDNIVLALGVGAIALYLLNYAFDDMKKALAIAVGVYLLRISINLLPSFVQNPIHKSEEAFNKAKDTIPEVIKNSSKKNSQ